MPNKSHYNSGHIAMNRLAKSGTKHSSAIEACNVTKTFHALYIRDAVEFLKTIPDNSIQLVIVDPPYNLDLEAWDSFTDYLSWAKQWIDHIYRILTDNGNCVIFGGFQFQDLKQGDLLEILHYARHNTNLRLVNLIIWYYKNGFVGSKVPLRCQRSGGLLVGCPDNGAFCAWRAHDGVCQ